MSQEKMNTLILKRFCGEEYYPLEDAKWSIWNQTTFCLEMSFGEGSSLHEDTEELAESPLWELYFNVPAMDEQDVKPGMILEEKDNREDETHFYYCEHQPTANNRLEVLGREGGRILVRVTGECCDVNYYDGSKGNNILEIEAWIDPE
jgi:hypothetical protein